MYIPGDEINPQWRRERRSPHDWHNYVSQDVREIWSTFNAEQKKALAECFDDIASNEVWD